METQQPIVHRSGVPSRRRTASLDDEVRVIDATLWPTSDEPAAAMVSSADTVEASLLPPTTRLVREFPVIGLERDYVRHLERRILRRPRDLESHVRRILALNGLKDADGIAGALADLFLVLGRRGWSLRERLYIAVRKHIAPAHARFFKRHLDRGLSPTDVMPSFERSRLSKQVIGTTHIVVTDDNASSDAFELAQAAAEADRDNEARELLEGHLDVDPGNAQVCEMLLDIYERNSLDREFFRTYTRYLGRPLACFDRWLRMAAKFRDSSDALRDDSALDDGGLAEQA